MEAFGLDPVDHRIAVAGHADWAWPRVPDPDVVGVVDALGEGVTGTHVGRCAACPVDLRHRGGFGEYAPAQAAVPCRPGPARRRVGHRAAVRRATAHKESSAAWVSRRATLC
ncbi:hypothetical protein [Actinacidiphila sp. bgisy160]|uniref:hypothetical protein n=1 Tax=Actinacidiphila sp. bgisy160 TaxID=3413796 RepID=UPI003D757E2D